MLPSPNQPPLYDLLNPQGNAPLMIACDHGGNSLPEDVFSSLAGPEMIELHIAYDIGARQVARILSKKFDAPALIANYSRLLMDLNRHPGDPEQMPTVSDGHRIAANENIDQQQIEARLQAYFYPYHHCHGEMVDRLKQKYRRPLILSIHSFTPVMRNMPRPWHFGVLWDRDKVLADNLMSALRKIANNEEPPLVIGDNQPYGASNPTGYSISEHAAKKGVEMALIEIRQDLLLDEAGQEWAARVLFDAIAPLLDHQSI